MQLPRETAIAVKGALLHVGGIASDDLPLPCRIRGSAAIYSIPGAIIRRLAIESMVSPERSKESKATSYGPRPRKGSFTLISRYTRIGYSRGSLRVEESPPVLCAKTEMSDGYRRLALHTYEENSPRQGYGRPRTGRVAVHLPGGGRDRLADHDRNHALHGLAAVRGDAAKALAWYENMPIFEICWSRRRFLEWRRNPENAPLLIEAILLERVLLDGSPQLEIVAWLAAIDEDRTDEAAARDLFWRDARRKLGKLRRLSPRDIWQVEILLAKRISKPQKRMPPQTVRASANSITGPHKPLQTLRVG
jgi:hypothetical protein